MAAVAFVLDSLGDGERTSPPERTATGVRAVQPQFIDLEAGHGLTGEDAGSTDRHHLSRSVAQYTPDGKRVVFFSNRSGSVRLICDA
jgi:hypothetical protein